MYLALFGNTCQYFHGGGQHAGIDVAEVCRDSAFPISSPVDSGRLYSVSDLMCYCKTCHSFETLIRRLESSNRVQHFKTFQSSESKRKTLLTDFCFSSMLLCMRTTLNLDDRLYQAAKIKAASEGTTVTQVIQDALKEFLHRPNQTRSKYKLRWPTQKGRLLPGVNPDDRTSLYDAMDGRE